MCSSPSLHQMPAIEKTLTQEQIRRYSLASGDDNLIHLDPDFAASTIFGGTIAHGMLTLAFVSEMLTRAFGADWLSSGALKVRFKGAAHPGDQVRTWGEVTEEREITGGRLLECAVGLTNSLGEALIAGTATVKVSRDQRQGGTPPL